MYPWHLKGTPYAVQNKALIKANGQRGFGFFMEMGLGKTATAYNEFVNLYTMDLVSQMIIICPQSLKQVWVAEAKEWEVKLNIEAWPKITDTWDILAINYEAMIGKGGQYIEEQLQLGGTYLVLDESIHVKNPNAKRTKRIIGLASYASYVRILSGAPIVKSPLDIWGQFRCIGELKGKNQYAFRNRYCKMGGYLGKQIVGVRNHDELTSILDQSSFRAKKTEWTDLPDTLCTTRRYTLSGDQYKQYETMRKELVLQVENETITAPMVITQMMKLQQISSGFIIDEQGEINELVLVDQNPKLMLVKEILEEINTKIIIFAFYKQSIKYLSNLMKQLKITYSTLKGNQSEEDQVHNKQQFNEGTATVMIAQLTAGKYGHTLLGSKENPCHTTIFYENNYDLDARVQAEARNHRHGQNYPVTYVDIIGTSLDEKIIQALQKKQSMAEAIVDSIQLSGH